MANEMKRRYTAPGIGKSRVFLEEILTSATSAQVVGSGAGVTQNTWDETPIAAPAENDVIITL
jgi:hypothetical protein